MSSILQYNGIQIPFIKTEKFSQESVWSTDGVDLLYTHITIGISGVLHKCFLGIEPGDWVEQNRPALLQRGGQLYFILNGQQVFPPPNICSPNTSEPTGNELVASPNYENPSKIATSCGSHTPQYSSYDSKLGPKPVLLDIRQIQGGSLTIYYEIETWLPYCCANCGAQSEIVPLVLSNRWESTIEIDKDYFYTRTTNGVLVINGQYSDKEALVLSTLSAGTQIILPQIPNNWKRESVRFVRSSDGLTVNWTIVDRQQYVAMPRPCAVIDASYTEISPANMGENTPGLALLNMQQLNMQVTVAGEPSYDYLGDPDFKTPMPIVKGVDGLKMYLMQVMFSIVFSRIQFPFIQTNNGNGTPNEWADNCFITKFELKEDVMKPIVGCNVTAFRSRPLSSNSLAPVKWKDNVFALTSVGQPIKLPDIINQVSRQPTTLSNYAQYLLIQTIASSYPCYNAELIAVEGGEPNIIPYNTNVYSTMLTTATLDSAGSNTGQNNYSVNFSQANYQFPFTEYSGDVNYVTDNHYIVSPIMYDINQATDNSVEFSQSAPPTSRKLVHWKASRMGSWPKAPSPTSLDLYGDSSSRDKVLNYQIGLAETELLHDGLSYHYVINGVTEIGLARRLQWDVPTGTISTIVNPVIASSVWGDQYSTYPCSLFVDGILDAGPSPGNS
jgi:hypothetical protein